MQIREGLTQKAQSAGADAPPELDAVKVEVAVRREREVDLVIGDRVIATLLLAREQL